MRDVRISQFQASISILFVTIGTVFFPVAGIVVPLAGAAGWVAILVAFLIAAPWVLMAVSLVRHAPVGDWGQSVQAWLGPWLGRAFLLYFAFIWAWLGGMLLAQGALVFHNMALPRTPPSVLASAILFLIVIVDIRGVEVFMRTVEALMMMIIPLLIGFFVVAIGGVNLQNLQPLFGEAPIRVAHAAYHALPWVMEGILFALFAGVHLRVRKRLGIITLGSIAAAGVALAITTAVTLGVLGRVVTETYVYPTVVLSQVAQVGFFLQGLEIFLFPLWLLTSFIKVGASFLLVSESIRGIWQGAKQPYRALLIGAIFYAINTIPNTVAEIVAFLSRVDNTFFIAFYGIIPVVWLWVKLSGKGEQKKHADG